MTPQATSRTRPTAASGTIPITGLLFNGNHVSYDLDGNMLHNGVTGFAYDSANRLVSAGGHTYTYNAEDVRIRNLCSDADTTYTYDVNGKLSRLLCKTTNGIVTKYVYGRGLIGEEKCDAFKTYHFDCRGSTIAITDIYGNITDTFAYDTYGKMISRTGNSFVIFGYNGRDGVVTDKNGLIYMRARYYSPDMKRFVNADIVAGQVSNAVTLNRFAYANGNPVSFVDPFGLWSLKETWNSFTNWVSDTVNNVKDWAVDTYNSIKENLKDTSSWVDTNVMKPAKTALADFGKQINDGFNSAAESVKDFGFQVGELAKNTFGAGVVQSQTYDTMSMDTLIAGYEIGDSSSSVIYGDISKPISVYAKNASEWWKIWEYKVGIQVNIKDGGFYLETNPLENAVGFSNGNKSLEFMSGLNKIGYTESYEVDFSERTSAGKYYHGYIRTIPTAAAVVTICYFGLALLNTLPAGAGAVTVGAL